MRHPAGRRHGREGRRRLLGRLAVPAGAGRDRRPARRGRPPHRAGRAGAPRGLPGRRRDLRAGARPPAGDPRRARAGLRRPDQPGRGRHAGLRRGVEQRAGRPGGRGAEPRAGAARDRRRAAPAGRQGRHASPARSRRPPPVAGSSLVLTIDSGVQQVAERELAAAVLAARTRPYYRGGKTLADSGSVVVMEARTGRVVALASYPSYDPAVFTGGISTAEYADLLDPAKGSPLLFRAIAGGYAPASTFKAVTSTAAVENGQATFSTMLDCPGVFAPTGQTNFEAADLGPAQSCARDRAVLRHQLLQVRLRRVAARRRQPPGRAAEGPDHHDGPRLRARQKTGIDLPGESAGVVPTRQWRKDYWQRAEGRPVRRRGQQGLRRRRAGPATGTAASTAPGSAAARPPTSRSARARRW